MIEDPTNYYYQGSFTMWIKGGKISKITGGEREHTRVQEQTELIKRFVHLLPDMNVTIWTHDTSVMHLTGEKRCVILACMLLSLSPPFRSDLIVSFPP